MLTERLKEYHITLGSVSPRRHELLASLGLTFDSIDPDIPENAPPDIRPEELAVYLAIAKSKAIGTGPGSHDILITADTVVLCDQKVLAKPDGRAEAIEFLKLLSGKEHLVITGVCISSIHKTVTFSSETVVTFSQLETEEIEYYVDSYKPFDKAGAYGIQEWIGFVATERIEGSYFNVMGMPVNRLYRELKEFIK